MNVRLNKYIGACLLAVSILTISCGGAKNVTDKSATKDTQIQQPKIKLSDYYTQGVNFNTFNGKASMQYKDSKQNQKLGATIKMNDNKDLWTSVSTLGGIVEVARAYITPDSLKALVPLTKDAYALSYKEGLAMIQAELDFATLQNLMVGNPLIVGAKNAEIKEEQNNIVVKVQQNGYQLTITYDPKTQLIKEQLIHNVAKKFSCLIKQTNYKPLTDKQPFSFTRQMTIDNNGEKMNLDMDFSKAEINIPVSVNFRIPDSYTIKQIK